MIYLYAVTICFGLVGFLDMYRDEGSVEAPTYMITVPVSLLLILVEWTFHEIWKWF